MHTLRTVDLKDVVRNAHDLRVDAVGSEFAEMLEDPNLVEDRRFFFDLCVFNEDLEGGVATRAA